MEKSISIVHHAHSFFTQPVKLIFKPAIDMTPIESAWCAMLFVQHAFLSTVEDFEAWDIVKRHFIVERHEEK